MEPRRPGLRLLDVAAAVHELKNPAETLMNILYLLEQNSTLDESGREYVELAQRELARMRDMLNAMLTDWREGSNPLVSVAKVMDAILRLHEHKIAFKQIRVEKQYAQDGLVKADAEDVHQIFANLVMNALEALPPEGKLLIRTCSSEPGAKKRAGIRVVIADNGPGISPEHQEKVFQESFTSKGQRGSGLGLRLTAEIIRKYGGSIRFRSSTKQGHSGTVFSVRLPAREAAYSQQAEGTSVMNKAPVHQKLEPKENRAIAGKLIAESQHLVEHIRTQSQRHRGVRGKKHG